MKENSLIFSRNGKNALPRARARFLAQAIQLEESNHSSTINLAIYFTLLLMLSAIIWAWSTDINEVAISRGEVIPAGLIHNIQHFEGGIVEEINVRNGTKISTGDLLIRFSPHLLELEREQLYVKKASLDLEMERLHALFENRAPDFSAFEKKFPILTKKQQIIFKGQKFTQETELKVIDKQISLKALELKRQKNQAKSIQRELKLLKEQVAIRQKLSKQKIVSRTELISSQSNLASSESEYRTIQDGVFIAESALEETQLRRLETSAQFTEELELKAGEVASQLAEVNQFLNKIDKKSLQLSIYAPITGIIKSLTVNNINEVVEPGQVILQIVPIDDEMIIEAKIIPEEIGRIGLGQDVNVKFDSYDPARYGTVNGKVSQLSASTYLDDRQEPYYRAEITLEKNYVGNVSSKMKIIPGMTVQAEVKTGSKSILDYLMKPVSRGFSNAFTEE
ncbi:MAG: HlyD family type I secretion periplasmic adaptor subunit [Proteobacteria bacterium]|nr:HlyD family type I secretion periplasmic adaptor subunit [Pseudomonadota bacterium]